MVRIGKPSKSVLGARAAPKKRTVIKRGPRSLPAGSIPFAVTVGDLGSVNNAVAVRQPVINNSGAARTPLQVLLDSVIDVVIGRDNTNGPAGVSSQNPTHGEGTNSAGSAAGKTARGARRNQVTKLKRKKKSKPVSTTRDIIASVGRALEAFKRRRDMDYELTMEVSRYIRINSEVEFKAYGGVCANSYDYFVRDNFDFSIEDSYNSS